MASYKCKPHSERDQLMLNKHDFSTSLEILDGLIDDYNESQALNHTYMDIEIKDFDTIQDDLRFLIECYEKAGIKAQFNKIKADEALEADLKASREREKELETDNNFAWLWLRRFLFVPEYPIEEYGILVEGYPGAPWREEDWFKEKFPKATTQPEGK